MRGSDRDQFNCHTWAGQQVYSVPLPGQTFWVWTRRTATGELLAHSENLFPDYVACLCDAQRHQS